MPAAVPPDPIPGARLLFPLDPAVSHLNHGSFGAVPTPVHRIQQRVRAELEANPVRFFTSSLAERIGHARRHLAAFVGADPEGTALVPNATSGASIVLRTLRLQAGDEIIRTDHGYGAVALAVARACQVTGAVSRTVPLPLPLYSGGTDAVAAIHAAVSDRTRLVVIDQVTSPTAQAMPAQAVADAFRDTDIAVFVDGAHAPGLLPAVAADFWVGNLHKWAYAPIGSALFQVAQRWRADVQPLVVSWEDPAGFPANLEFYGAADYTPWLAAPAGAYVLRSLGLDTVRTHNAALAAYAQQVVGDALGLTPDDLPGPGTDTPLPMRIVPLPAGVAADGPAAAALRQRISTELQTEVAVNAWNGRGLLRLSAQVYNRPEEYERFGERLVALLRTMERE